MIIDYDINNLSAKLDKIKEKRCAADVIVVEYRIAVGRTDLSDPSYVSIAEQERRERL